MKKEATKFCTYCRCRKPASIFRPVRERRTGRLVNSKCDECRALGKLPVEERDRRGKEFAEARREFEAKKQDALKRAREDDLLTKLREGGHEG